MNEEEKKIKEMEELGIELTDSPKEALSKASPTKLKLQALTFMIIGKIERHYLNNMLKQAKDARDLATANLKNITTMSDTDKKIFTDKLDSNVSLLEEKVAIFDENYGRAIGYGKRSLKIPSTNLSILAKDVQERYRQKYTGELVDAYNQMNDVFSSAKKSFDAMPKPVKRNVEISRAEQENIRKSVYQALKDTSDKEVERIASNFDEEEKNIDKVIEKDTNTRRKEKELDNFFNNISPIKSHTPLTDDELGAILNFGKVKDSETKHTSTTLSKKDLSENLNDRKPKLSVDTKSDIFDGQPTPVSPHLADSVEEYDAKDTHLNPKKVESNENDEIGGMLLDKDVKSLTDKVTKEASSSLFNDNTSFDLDVNDLEQQLNESINEIERKRQAKEEARKKYEAEKQAREQEETELSESKKALEEMKREIERKREEQKAIEKLNQRVEKALKYQRQIEENRRAALEEEEEAKKYQETLRVERENQTKMAREKEKIQSEREVLQSETSKVDSNLQKEKERLEEAKRQLQMLTSMGIRDISMRSYSHTKHDDVEDNDFFAKPTTRSSVSKARIADIGDMEMNGFYVAPPIQESDEPTTRRR